VYGRPLGITGRGRAMQRAQLKAALSVLDLKERVPMRRVW